MGGIVPIRRAKNAFFVEAYPENGKIPGGLRGRGTWLQRLFEQQIYGEPLHEYLGVCSYGVTLAMITLDKATAKAIRLLQSSEVQFRAWIVLDEAYGYWTNRTNVDKTISRTEEVIRWCHVQGIDLTKIGFDLEWPITLAIGTSSIGMLAYLRALFSYRAKLTMHTAGQKRFMGYTEDLLGQDFDIECYVAARGLPGILTGGLLTPKGCRTVQMAYTSLLPKSAALDRIFFRFLWDRSRGYTPAIGIVGNVLGTTPGRDLSVKLPRHLSVREVARLLRVIGDRYHCVFALDDVGVLQAYADAKKLSLA